MRTHLKTCLSCRARLREFRGAPARIAALAPAAVVASEPAGGSVRGALESLAGAFGERVHTAVELAAGQKAAAVAASAAAIAGGAGVAHVPSEPAPRREVAQAARVHRGPPRPPPRRSRPAPRPRVAQLPPASAPELAPPGPVSTPPAPPPPAAPAAPAEFAPSSAAAVGGPPSAADPGGGGEFTP